jgi:hypothetical protein
MAILALAALVATTGHAQIFRQLPANGQLGQLSGGQQQPYPLVTINDQVARLAPGGRIYDQSNRLIVHGSLPPSAAILFLQDMNGDVSRIYILRDDELEQIQQRLLQQQQQ